MAEKRITLPDHEEMLRRLVAVDDNDHLQERFYPILLQSAGRQLVGQGVVMMFTLAISDYTQGMPASMERVMFLRVPDFIDALVTDAEAATEAKEFLKAAL